MIFGRSRKFARSPSSTIDREPSSALPFDLLLITSKYAGALEMRFDGSQIAAGVF